MYRLALKNPRKEVFAKLETNKIFSLVDLANQVKDAAKININIKIKKIKNPRFEKENHYYNPTNKSFNKIGLKPLVKF